MTTTRIRRLLPLFALVLAVATWVAACKQEEGERCQVDEDCSDGLLCNQATQECSRTTGGGIDASVPDGPPVDAAIDAIDSNIDAPIDAMIDATVL